MNSWKIMKNEVILNTVLCLLSGYKKMRDEGSKKEIDGLRYLLGQSIRQYNIPKEKYHISVGAKQRWEELSDDKIENYWYRKQVTCNKLHSPKLYRLYKGSENEGKERILKPGDSFTFRDMFHEEHIIPVKLILNKMINITNNINMSVIKELLESMHMCIILKEEDRFINQELGKTANRTNNFEENVKNIYNKCGITLVPYE